MLWLLFGVLAMLLPLPPAAIFGIIGGGAFVALVLGQIFRGWAAASPENFAKTTGLFSRIYRFLTLPLTACAVAFGNFFLRLCGVDLKALDAGASEDEIRQMVKEGGEKGSIDTFEQEMIDNIFEFDDTSAQDICTHRTEIEAIDIDAGRDEIIKTIVDTKYSRYPVYEESIDNIIGVVHIKDILKYIFTEKDLLEDFKLREHMTSPYFAPVSKKIDELFADLNAIKAHMAIIVDEYGGCYGLVTLEDLVEEIVGKIYDETDDIEGPDFEEAGQGRFKIKGGADLVEAADVLGIDLPVEDFETIGGFLVHLLERVPMDGERPKVSYMGYNFYVKEVRERRIHSIFAEYVEKNNLQKE